MGGIPVLGYDVAPQGGRLVIHEDEAERVREIFTICAGTPTLASVQREVNARGFKTKNWTSKRGQRYRARVFNPFTLGALLGAPSTF